MSFAEGTEYGARDAAAASLIRPDFLVPVAGGAAVDDTRAFLLLACDCDGGEVWAVFGRRGLVRTGDGAGTLAFALDAD